MVDSLVIGGCSDLEGAASDSKGLLEVATPVGVVELKVREGIVVLGKANLLEATVTVEVTDRETALAAVKLRLAPKDEAH